MRNRKRRRHNGTKKEKIIPYFDRELPLKAKSITNLEMTALPKKNELENTHLNAKKRNRPEEKHNPTEYHYKTYQDSKLAQLEAYSASICRLLAGEEYVPSTTIYYDTNETIHGVASKKFEDFKSLHENPLSAEDMEISIVSIQQQFQQNLLMSGIVKLLNYLESKNDTSKIAKLSAFFGSRSAIGELIYKLNIFREDGNRFSWDSMENLKLTLAERKLQLDDLKDQFELDLIAQINQCRDKLNTLNAAAFHESPMSIEELEEIDNQIKSKSIDIHQQPLIEINVGERELKVKSEDILHYRIIKGLATSLVTRYVYKEGDNNALNNAKDGKMVDFEMTNLPLSFRFKTLDPLSKLAREPQPDAFICTAKDIREFPDVTDADFYIWPTKQTYMLLKLIQLFTDKLPTRPEDNEQINTKLGSIKEFIITNLGIRNRPLYERTFAERAINNSIDEKFSNLKPLITQLFSSNQEKFVSVENTIRGKLKKVDQLYTSHDNQQFKIIGLHPVFEYFKYKTFLKLLLLDPKLYDFLAKLNISKSAEFLDDANGWKLLRATAVQQSIERRDEIEKVLTDMPEFHLFLAFHGETALKQIVNELSVLKEKYGRKVAEKPYYQELVDALDIHKVINRYEIITGIDMSSLQHEPVVKHRRCS